MADAHSHTAMHGVLAEFASTGDLYHACEKIRDAGFKRFDAHTPFPVHGLERAMGLPSSRLPWIVLVMGLSGALGGFLLQWWVSVEAYPIIVSGKPLFSWQAFVPVTFELGVLFGAFGAVVGMFLLNKLPCYYHPVFHSKAFGSRAADDGFFLSIEATDPQFDANRTPELLQKLGAVHVEWLAE